LEKLESRLAPATNGTWTDALRDGNWCDGRNWNDPNGVAYDRTIWPRAGGDTAFLKGVDPNNNPIPGPTIASGSNISLTTLSTDSTFGGDNPDTLTINGVLAMQLSGNTVGSLTFTFGNITLGSGASIYLNDGATLFDSASGGFINSSAASLGSITVDGQSPNGTPSTITLTGGFTKLGVNLTVGDTTLTGLQGQVVVDSNIRQAITLSQKAGITLNSGKLFFNDPATDNDGGIKPDDPASIVSLSGNAKVELGDGKGTFLSRVLWCPALIGGGGSILLSSAIETHICQDSNGNSIKLSQISDNLNTYIQEAGVGVTADGNMSFSGSTCSFPNGTQRMTDVIT
jgi:hypothetical protein